MSATGSVPGSACSAPALSNALKPGGYKVPQWNKTAKGSGGAVCTATITSTHLGSHAWSVDFVMQ